MPKRHSFTHNLTGGTPHHHWLGKVVIEAFVGLGAVGAAAFAIHRVFKSAPSLPSKTNVVKKITDSR